MRYNWLILAIVFIAAIAGGIYIQQPFDSRDYRPDVLRIGVLPDERAEYLRTKYDPLVSYLSEQVGIDAELKLPADYGELVRWFRDAEIDLAYFGGLTFVQANRHYEAEPLVMRDVDTRFTSYFLVRAEQTARDISDLRGKKFSFGSRLSTSGHLMPRHMMAKYKQIKPEEFFAEVQYSGAHDKTAYHVRDGIVDIGVANSEVIRRMFDEGRLSKNDVRVLWVTPPYPDYVWATQCCLDEQIRSRLREAFLGLRAVDENHRRILQALGAETFLPAGKKDFKSLMIVADDLGLLSVE